MSAIIKAPDFLFGTMLFLPQNGDATEKRAACGERTLQGKGTLFR
jgi:hypothetical protein